MRIYFTFPLMLAILLCTACSKSNTASNTTATTVVGTVDQTATVVPTPTPFTSAEKSCNPYNVIDDAFLAPIDNKIPTVTENDLSYGPTDAKYTFIVYSNFTCSHCADLEPTLVELQKLYPQTVRVVFRYVTTGGNSNIAAQAAEAANKQGKFSEMKDALFTNQATWYYYSEDEFLKWLDEQASSFGMNVEQFNADLKSDETLKKIEDNRAKVDEVGIVGTPTIYVNNREYVQGRSLALFTTMLNVMDISDRLISTCPTVNTNFTKDLQAVISTNKGDIVVDLFEDKTPSTVAYFKYLADSGWYNHNNIIMANKEYIISGDPSNTLYGGPGFAFYAEVTPDQPLNEAGLLVSFNQLGSGFNTGVFMLTRGAVSNYSGEYSVFGKVIEGNDVLNAISDRSYSYDPGAPFYDTINSITIVEK